MIEPSNLIELPSSIELEPERFDRSLESLKLLGWFFFSSANGHLYKKTWSKKNTTRKIFAEFEVITFGGQTLKKSL